MTRKSLNLDILYFLSLNQLALSVSKSSFLWLFLYRPEFGLSISSKNNPTD